MGVHRHGSTTIGGLTPICNDCGVSLCWDIGRTEYLEAKAFWEAWTCQDCNGSRLSAYGWKLENSREALPPAVEAAIIVFSETHAHYGTHDGADGHSGEASNAFCLQLAAAGLSGEIKEIANVDGNAHKAVVVGDFTIDWTASQHDSEAPFPLVYRSALGWPIEPAAELEGNQDFFHHLAKMSDEEIAALAARVAERRLAG